MRENLARLIVLITGILVVMLSMVFARIQNPDKLSILETKQVTQGRHVFLQQGCARCHSIKGEGNQRTPLDGVAKKYTDKEMRNWIMGAKNLEGKMTQGIMKVKSKYQKLSKDELDALVRYMKLE